MRSAVINHQLAMLVEESGASHAAIARQVVLLGKTEYGLRLAYDYRSVGRWLRGAVPDPPAPRLLAAVLSRMLGRGITLYQLGFDHGEVIRRSLTVHPAVTDTVGAVTELWGAAVQRRDFLHTSATFVTALAIEAAMDWRDLPATRSVHQAAGTVTVTDTEVAALRQAHAEFQLLDHSHGGGYALPWLEQYLHTEVTPLLHGRYSDAAGRELFLAAAALTDMAGWMAMDMSLHSLGQRYYTQAAALARHAGDRAYGAYAIGNLATQALFIGQTRTCIRLARTARAAGGRAITPTLTARLAGTEARAHALAGDRHETHRMLAVAQAAVDRSDPARDPAWLGVFTPAHHAGNAMHALRDLGEPAQSATRAADALTLPARNTRTRALHGILYASVLLDCGDLDGAIHTATPVQHAASGLKSRRLDQRLDEFTARLIPYQRSPAASDYLQADAARRTATAPAPVRARSGRR